jgi:hypothetical protein
MFAGRSGAAKQVEQAAGLAFEGAGRIAVIGASAGKQSHHPESREQPAQVRYLLALARGEIQGHGKVAFMQPEAALVSAAVAGVMPAGGGDVRVAVEAEQADGQVAHSLNLK